MITTYKLSQPRLDIILHAHQWLNTPYHDQARVKGHGVDCAMFVFMIARECNFVSEDTINKIPPYSPQWHLHNDDERLLKIMEDFGCEERPKDEKEIGDILTFKFGRVTSHLGIACPNDEFIHADLKSKKVVRVGLKAQWIKRLTHVYKFPGVD